MKRRQLLIGGGGLIVAGAGAVWWGLRRMGSLDGYAVEAAQMRALLAAQPTLLELVRYATLAASGHNTQAWLFRIDEERIEILPDLSRRTPVVDPDDHHLFTSLGCAAENLALAASARGRPGEVRFEAANEGSVVFSFGGADAPNSELFDAVPLRQSTRAEFDGVSVSALELGKLAEAARVPGVDVVLLTERRSIDAVRDLVVAGNTLQMADAAFVKELASWLRFSPRQALAAGDGLFGAASGSPIAPAWLGALVFERSFSVEKENDKYARQLRSSSGVAVFVAQKEDREHWVRVGRACQRFALQATALGLKHSFVNQAVEVAALRPDLAALVGMPGRRPDLVMRFGRGPTLPYSPRRPVSAVVLGVERA
jgi:hypothetical protein